MPYYKVRTGQQLGISGKSYGEGAVLQLSKAMVEGDRNLNAKLLPCDRAGNSEVPLTKFEHEMLSARRHERKSLLEAEKKRLLAELDKVNAALAAERG